MKRNGSRDRSMALAWAALVVVYLVWGSTYLAIRVGVRDIPPAMLAGGRYLIAGALLYPVAVRTGDERTRGEDRPGAKQWLACALVGVLLLVLGNGGLTLGERTVPSGLAAVLVATVPLWMILFAVPVQRHRVGCHAAAGLVVGLVGVAVLAGGGSVGRHAAGVVIVLGASAAWGLGSVLGHRLPLPRRALLAAAIEMLVGGILLLITALVRGEFSHLHWASVHATSWLALAWLIVPGSILAFSAYGYSLAHLPLATVSTYAYVNPVVAVILGVTLLHEGLTGREALGAALVVGSVALTLHRPTKDLSTPDAVPTPDTGDVHAGPKARTHPSEITGGLHGGPPIPRTSGGHDAIGVAEGRFDTMSASNGRGFELPAPFTPSDHRVGSRQRHRRAGRMVSPYATLRPA